MRMFLYNSADLKEKRHVANLLEHLAGLSLQHI